MDRWLFLIHILGAMIWLGGGITLSVLGDRARNGDARLIGDFSKTLSYVGLRVLMPAVIAVLVTGVWMVLAGSGWNFGQLWVLLGLGAFLLAFLIGGVYLSRAAIRLERLTSAENADLAEIRSQLTRWINGYGVVLLVLVFAVWDMVFKPGM